MNYFPVKPFVKEIKRDWKYKFCYRIRSQIIVSKNVNFEIPYLHSVKKTKTKKQKTKTTTTTQQQQQQQQKQYTAPGAIIGDGDRKRAPFLVLGLSHYMGQ